MRPQVEPERVGAALAALAISSSRREQQRAARREIIIFGSIRCQIGGAGSIIVIREARAQTSQHRATRCHLRRLQLLVGNSWLLGHLGDNRTQSKSGKNELLSPTSNNGIHCLRAIFRALMESREEKNLG